MQCLKAEFFELDADVVHTQAIGDGCVNLQRLFGDAFAFFAIQCADGSHVVESVSELDQNDADVFRHGQGHLLEIFGLGFGAGLEDDFELAHAIHQFCYFFVELFGQQMFRDTGVFNYVVQQCRHQALVVHMHAGQNRCDCKGMGNVGFAGAAFLPVVGRLSIGVGFPHLLNLALVEILTELDCKRVDSQQRDLRWPVGSFASLAGTSGQSCLRLKVCVDR